MKKPFFFCALMSTYFATAQKFQNEITFIQNKTIQRVTDETASITLDKQPFTIAFDNMFYHTKKESFHALQVAIIVNDEDLANIEEGMPVSLIPYFETGTGMSADEDGFYSSAIVNSYGHHYLFYENEQNRNIRLLSKKDGIGKFEWQISRLYIREKDYPLEKIPDPTLTFVFLNDLNSNGIVDVDELRVVNIRFK